MTDGACIGLDVGTSGVKGLVVAADGGVIATASADYPLLTPRPGWTEQVPEAWWRASCAVLRTLLAKTPDRSRRSGSPARCTGRCFSTPMAR